MDVHLQHPPKQLESIELKLEIDSEKEGKSKPKHETHIMLLLTSKYMSRLHGKGAAHMAKGTEVDEGKCTAKTHEIGRARSTNQGLRFCKIIVEIIFIIIVHIFGRALSNFYWMKLDYIISNIFVLVDIIKG